MWINVENGENEDKCESILVIVSAGHMCDIG
jgi:hypothetical protein